MDAPFLWRAPAAIVAGAVLPICPTEAVHDHDDRSGFGHTRHGLLAQTLKTFFAPEANLMDHPKVGKSQGPNLVLNRSRVWNDARGLSRWSFLVCLGILPEHLPLAPHERHHPF